MMAGLGFSSSKRGQFICQISSFCFNLLELCLLSNIIANINTNNLQLLFHVEATHIAIDDWMMMMMMMSWVACGWLARSVARCVFQRATESDDGSSKVFEAADLMVSPRLLLRVGGWRCWSTVSDGPFVLC